MQNFFVAHHLPRYFTSCGLRLLAFSLLAASAFASDLSWDANGVGLGVTDGAGTWDTSNINWFYGVTVVNTPWNNGTPDNATFGAGQGPAGTVTLGTPINVGNLTLNAAGSGNYVIAGAGPNTLTLQNSTLTCNSAALLSVELTGTSGLIKTGSSALTLTGSNAYSGVTSVQGGSLFLNNGAGSGAGTSSITVINSGTILGGDGSLSGSVSVGAAATLAPGAAAASVAIFKTGALTLQTNSTLAIDLNGLAAGSGYDQVNVTGAVTVTGSNLTVLAGAGLHVNDKVFIALNDGTDSVIGQFTQGTTLTSGADRFQINYADNGDGGAIGNDISLTVIAVPEPATAAGGAGLGFLFTAWLVRRGGSWRRSGLRSPKAGELTQIACRPASQ